MYKRSDLRRACYKAQRGVPTKEQKLMLAHIEPLLQERQSWENFSKDWDILISKNNQIVIIKPETDYNFIHSACLEASIFYKKNIEFDFDDRKNNIIKIVENQMLDGIMSWANYNEDWGIDIDRELKVIKTKLFKRSPIQKEVTEEMIKNSSKTDGSAHSQASLETSSVEMEPMTEEQKELFQKFLKERNL